MNIVKDEEDWDAPGLIMLSGKIRGTAWTFCFVFLKCSTLSVDTRHPLCSQGHVAQ